MSAYYNQDITKRREKDKHHDLIVALREGLTQLRPISQVCYHCGQEGHFHLEWKKGEQTRRQPHHFLDPALSAKVTTGGLSAPISRWKVRCHPLWIDRSQPPVHAPFLGINVEEPLDSHYGRKTKDHFPARQWSPFLCLNFLSWSLVQWQGHHLGHIWQSPGVLVYPASGLLLGRPSLLSLFPHST
jgi:hypothetical protein